MSAHAHPRLTEEEYLKIERAAEFKSEFFDGVMYPKGGPYGMSGGSAAHALIIPNLAAELRHELKPKPCAVYVTELRLRIAKRGSYAYPDIAVVCGPPKYLDDQKDTLTNPTMLVEVLSPSTEAHDRGLKFAQYRQIESLREYGLVSQSEPRVEIFRRQSSGEWLLSEVSGLDAKARFDSLSCEIALGEIYHQVNFPEESPEV
jgi:Uma2 family endonuclease